MSDLFILSTDEKFQAGITPTSTIIVLGPVFNNNIDYINNIDKYIKKMYARCCRIMNTIDNDDRKILAFFYHC